MRTISRRNARGNDTLRQRQEAAARQRRDEARRRQASLAYMLLALAAGEIQTMCETDDAAFQGWTSAEFPGAVRLAHKYLNEARARLSGEVTP